MKKQYKYTALAVIAIGVVTKVVLMNKKLNELYCLYSKRGKIKVEYKDGVPFLNV